MNQESDMNDENDQPEQPEQPEHERREEPPTTYLTRSKMLAVEGVVYCLSHQAVHEDTTDPFDSGQDECERSEHRPVYYRGRKGDADEVETAPEPDDEEGKGDEPPADPLTGMQERLVRRIISPFAGQGLNQEEADVLADLVRQQVLRVEHNKKGAARIFGEDYDPALHDEKLDVLRSAYRKLGSEN